MQNQQPSFTPRRQLSQENIKAYFSSTSKNKLTPTLICMSIGAIIGIALVISGTAMTFSLALLGFCLSVGIICILFMRSEKKKTPTDKEYDTWLEAKVNHLYYEKLQILGIEPQQIVSDILFFRSYVLPSPQIAQYNRREKIYLKQGRDGKIRSNAAVYTFFIPTQYFIGVIVFDINTISPTHHNRQYSPYNRPYSYRSIINPTITSAASQKVLYNGTHCPCHMEKLSITIREGIPAKTIEITATVRATISVAGEPVDITPTEDLDRQVNLLRQILIMHE